MPWLNDILLSCLFLLVPLVGAPAVRWWERRSGLELDGATRVAASAALGIAWLQLGGMALIFTGTLGPRAAAAWLLAGLALAVLGLRRPRLPGPRAWALLPGLLVLAPLLLMATVPPWYQDDMTYHLALPRQFAVAGGYFVPDDNIFTFLPLGWESVLSLLYALGEAPAHYPPFNPRLLSVWTAGFAALATTGLARSVGAPRGLAWVAGLLLLLHPTLMHYAPSAYVEPWMLLLVALAAQGVARCMASGERAWLVPAGIFAGLSASAKFPGLVVTGLLGLGLMLDGLGRRGDRSLLRRLLLFGCTAAVVGSPFYLRNWIQRGNPVFPSAWGLLGGEGWSSLRAWAWGEILSNYGAGRAPLDYLLLPWRFFATRDMFDTFEGSNGPVLALGLVAASLLCWRLRAQRERFGPLALVLGYALGFSLFWALSTQQMRFWLPALPALVAVTVAGLAGLSQRLRAPLLGAVLLLSAGWTAGLERQVWDRQHTGPWLRGTMDEGAVLGALLPDSYGIFPEVHRLVPPGGRVWLVWMRNKTYYLERDFRVDCIFEAWRFEELLDAHEEPAAVAAELRREGFTHMLVHHRFFLVGRNADLEPGRTERLRERFVALMEAGVLRPVRRWDTIALYELAPSVETP
jgi:hypothetical protein